jgi:4-hydroxy-tetrahydrodipicolinate synthase
MNTVKFEAKGTFTALATPFQKNGEIDFPAFDKLLRFQIKNGITGIAVNSTTGEAPTLSETEKLELIKRAVKISKGRVPIIAGTGSYDTKKTIELTLKSQEAGASAALIVSPYYNKPTQAHLYNHYKTINDAVDLPIILYNVPGRTGSNVLPDTQLKIAADCKNIVATKEASGDINQILTIIRNKPADFNVLSGDDGITLSIIAAGANGVVSVLSNYLPKLMVSMVKYALQGKFDKSREIHERLFELMNVNFIESNPVPAKAAMSILGMINEYVRMPLQSATPESKKILREALLRAKVL